MERQGGNERLTTGIPGLDTVLAGGPSRGSTVLVLGPPGSGKTILASQLAFHRAAQGERVLYLTLLNESVDRLIGHLRKLRFFDEGRIPSSIYFVGAYAEARERGLQALVSFIARHVRQHEADVLIFDGLSIAESLAADTLAFQSFLYELSAALQVSSCTGVFLASRSTSPSAPEHYLLDVVLCLRDETIGMYARRDLQVLKFRGSDSLRGRHAFIIDDEGITVFPRLEALAAQISDLPPASPSTRHGFGSARLDEMLEGGLPAGSTTALVGAPGSGKTLLGLHFLDEGARRKERGLYFGFYESPTRLSQKSDGVGLGIADAVARGDVTLLWQPALEGLLDQLATRLLCALDDTGATRVVIDGIDGIRRSTQDRERDASFFTALTIELRKRGVTTLLTKELGVFSSEIRIDIEGLSAIVENIVLTRYVELQGRLRRLISILKVRESGYDSALREFDITPAGIDVVEATFDSAQHLMAGSPIVPARANGKRG